MSSQSKQDMPSFARKTCIDGAFCNACMAIYNRNSTTQYPSSSRIMRRQLKTSFSYDSFRSDENRFSIETSRLSGSANLHNICERPAKRRALRKMLIMVLSSPLAGKREIVVTILVRCMCVRRCVSASVHPCVRASIRICPDHNLYNNA